MSKYTHISKLNHYIQNQIVNALKLNGCMDDDIELLLTSGTLADIDDIMEDFCIC